MTAEFVTSSSSVQGCPKDTRAEYAFIGRSNVGKSSLINMLCGRKGLAKTSATPGKTLLINHFLIDKRWYIVDLPGYGYAKQSKSMREKLQTLITSYIMQREQLVNTFVLIDIRHDAMRVDVEFVNLLGSNGIPFALVFTKADKVGRERGKRNVARWLTALREQWEEMPPWFITSAHDGTGREAILEYIDKIQSRLG